MKWYGSIDNRLEEGRQFVEEIKVGDGVTEYYWSDREPWEVIAVKDQKHITIRKMNHRHVGDGCMDNSWELISDPDGYTKDLVKRGKNWYSEVVVTSDVLDTFESLDRDTDQYCDYCMFFAQNNIDLDKLREKGIVRRYHKMNISIGKAEYYYDYSF